jgi:protein dithiol oxidoreductase (disulfide-forming)
MSILKTSLSFLLFASVQFFSIQASFAEEYSEGIEYEALLPSRSTSTPQAVEVIEFFWYGCPHCFRLEPYLQKWVPKQANKPVKFIHIPAVFSPRWEFHARAFYTAKALQISEQSHLALFNEIHLKRKDINTEHKLMKFFSRFGITDRKFKRAYNSPYVDGRVKKAKKLTQKYKISGVPSLIINGKYVTSASQAGTNSAMIGILDQLVEQEIKTLKK